MKNIFLLGIIAVLVILPFKSFAESFGWANTKWGMTKTQVEKAVGKKLAYTMKNSDGNDVYIIKNHKINAVSYDVHLMFIENKLATVLLLGDGEYKEQMGGCISALRNFQEKYGRPVRSEINTNIKEATWSSGDTIVDMTCFGSPNSKSTTMILYKSKSERSKGGY